MTNILQSKVFKELAGWAVSILIAFAIAMPIRMYVFEPVETPTGSMLDTIRLQDRLIIYKLAYRFGSVKRGDIVVFKYPDDPSQNYLKRVIGIGGDTIQIKDGKLFVNGVVQEEDYIREPMDPDRDFGPITVPEGHYFMMGDNRNESNDSRYWIQKFVSKDAIVGKIIFRIYPLHRFGFVR